jgi:hypothetical protein
VKVTNKRPGTAQEHLRQFLSTVGRENSFEREASFLPFQVESLTLNNIGPFEKFEAHFQRNTVNVIYGPGGSGKSWIVRSILLAFGRRHRYFDDRTSGHGTVTLKIFSDQNSMSLTELESPGNLTKGYQCLIADDPFPRVNTHMLGPLLAELNHLGIQLILTLNTGRDEKTIGTHAHVISLEYRCCR